MRDAGGREVGVRMALKFKKGDYVYRPAYPCGEIRRVSRCGDIEVATEGGVVWQVNECVRVIVRPAKPRRTLTLSRGLAWLLEQCLDLHTHPDGAKAGDKAWTVSGGASCIHGLGCTPISAIIAARKAIGVRS